MVSYIINYISGQWLIIFIFLLLDAWQHQPHNTAESESHTAYRWPSPTSQGTGALPTGTLTSHTDSSHPFKPADTLIIGVENDLSSPVTWQSEYISHYQSPEKLGAKDATSHLLSQMKKINRMLAEVDHIDTPTSTTRQHTIDDAGVNDAVGVDNIGIKLYYI